ncbi:MAG: hypothetical protein IJP86_01165 [Synergistaceae bacterium]|nr:hypothetical protein [Synergistaceae bacterium]
MRRSYVFDRKLTEEEIRELVDSYEYDPEHYPDDGGRIWDEFGNPTEATICAWYESDHGITEGPFTDEEFGDWLDEVCAEADAEMAEDEARRTDQRIPA